MEICHHKKKTFVCFFCLLSLVREATLPIEAAQEFETFEINQELLEKLKETTPKDELRTHEVVDGSKAGTQKKKKN